MHLVETVAPIFAFQCSAAIMPQCFTQFATGDILHFYIESLPCSFPCGPGTQIPVSHAKIIGAVAPALSVHVHATDDTDIGIVVVFFQKFLAIGEKIGVRHCVVL